MLILGIDPGTATVGFGYVEVTDGQAARALSYGVIQTKAGMAMPDRLGVIFADLNELIGELAPDVMVVEELFFFRNVNTAIPVAQARGVIMLTASLAGVPVVSYTPMQVKKTIAGSGRADKVDVQEAVRDLLGLEIIPRPDDAADALAIALTHWQHLEGIGETASLTHLGAGGGRS